MKVRQISAAALMAIMAYSQSANADSSVELYGRVDASVNSVRFSSTAAKPGTRETFVSSDTSRWGIRGTEDLGGGLQAVFKLEHGFNVDTGSPSSATQYFNRESVVGLKHQTYGTILLGSQFTSDIWLSLRVDPFQRSNMGASFTLFQQGAGGILGYPGQYNNAVQYVSPNMGGWTARAMIATNEGVAPFGNPKSFGLEYSRDPLYVGMAVERSNSTGASAGQPARASVSNRSISLGAAYDLRVVKLYGYVIDVDVEGSVGMRGGFVGASVPVGGGTVSMTLQKRNARDLANSDARLVGVGYSYPLSRRTSVYIGAGFQRNDGNAAFGLWPSRTEVAGVPTPGADAKGYQIGMRHVF